MAKSFVNGGQAVIERRSLVIRVPIPALPQIVEGAWATNNWPVRYKVTNHDELAQALVNELNSESENGTTRIHAMFDAAILEAIDQGAFGIVEHEDQEGP